MSTKQLISGALSCVLLAGLLIACTKAPTETVTDDQPKDNKPGKPAVVLTELRTPTPVISPDQIPMGNQGGRPNPGGDGGGGGDNGVDVYDESGPGAEVDGYYQLLDHIDRATADGPGAWGAHHVSDMFDGLMETTDKGSNKYGHNTVPFSVTWSMDQEVVLSAYSIYTAKDSDEFPDRNPIAWKLYGSNGDDWVEIHSVEDGKLPAANYTGTLYEFSNQTPYKHYCWTVESTAGGAVQLSEMLLYTKEKIRDPQEVFADAPAFGSAGEGTLATPLTGRDAEFWMSAHQPLTDLLSAGSLISSISGYAGDEGVENLFDGIYTAEDFEAVGHGKFCGPAVKGYVIWSLTETVKPTGYAFYTGNDTAKYPDRNPISWVLYGATEDGEWIVLDNVKEGNMVAEDFAANVFTIDSEVECTRFCLAIERTNDAIQLGELILFQ